MILKSLELHGFKTFPDKTVLNFEKGISAVVGPNGSGKSNISDAIRWVLGEQSTKTLRCAKMEDVVFNGTTKRKSQGYAEVTLIIENAERRLPFDEDEVAITRRYYRSGESEYLINKVIVRLKDIHELFMDTGLGRDGYSIIGQGRIDSIVSSRSEDRREIFEEAAGISRYRYRKAEAEHKLSQAEENLIRLKDILSELKGRVGPLEEQSKKAKDFLEYSEEKRNLEISLWINTLEKSSKLIEEQDNKMSASYSQKEEFEKNLEDIQKEIESVFFKSNSYMAEIDKIRKDISEAEEGAIHKNGEASVLENDVVHNNENINRIKAEIKQIESTASDMESEVRSKEDEISNKKQFVENKTNELNEYIINFNDLQNGLNEGSEVINELSKQLSVLSEEASDKKVGILMSKTSMDEIKLRMDKFEDNIVAKEDDIESLKKSFEEYSEVSKDISERINDLTNVLNGYQIRLDSKKRKYESLKQTAEKLSFDAEDYKRRINILKDMEKNFEGFGQSVKVIMKEAEHGILRGIHGPVSKIIDTPGEYAVAIEIALGAAIQNIIVGTEEDAKRSIYLLKQKDCGRATFLPISTIKGKTLEEDDFINLDGFIGIASRLCKCGSQYSNILDSLLGRVLVANDIDSATRIAKKFSYKFRIVTLDGQVINAGGSLTGGSVAKKAGSITRKAEIDRLLIEYNKISKKSEFSRESLKELQADVSNEEACINATKAELSNAQEDKIRLDATCREYSSDIAQSQKMLEQLKKDTEESSVRLKTLCSENESAAKELEYINGKIFDIQDELDSKTDYRENLSVKRENLTLKIQDIKLEIMLTQKDIHSLNSEVSSIGDRRLSQSAKLDKFKDEIKYLEDKNLKLAEDINRLKTESQNLRESSEMQKVRIEELTKERMEFEKCSVELRKKERSYASDREVIIRDLARLEERKINLQKEYDNIITKLWDEYELTRREAESLSEKIDDVSKVQRRLNEIKLKIKMLGSVNVAAVEEYQEVLERYEFMQSQIDDVEESKNELSKLINELTHKMKDLFISKFKLINENFSITFRELFGGGSAELSITDTDNILSCGIDISVQPPGKIVKRLELLSGGEKALVAIALYFAIMKVNPAPFCVLDEIEAALDDVNVGRFASYLRKMNENTQFIVITHRRGTMEEADVLYGVTMQDEGVSKLLKLNVSPIGRGEKLQLATVN